MRILVTDGMDKGAIEKVRAMGHELVEQFYEPDELGKALRDFDVAIIRSKTKQRAKQIDEAKGSRFKCVIRAGVGLDNIDVQYAKDNGIEVKNTPKSPSESVAELAMAHMFSCARYISIAGHSMREGKWEKKAYGKGIELTGKTLGIVGFGRIGQKLGKMAKAIGMNVIAFDIFHIPGIEEELRHPPMLRWTSCSPSPTSSPSRSRCRRRRYSLNARRALAKLTTRRQSVERPSGRDTVTVRTSKRP